MFLIVILSVTPHGLKMVATALGRHQHITSIGEKGDVSSLCLFSGAKTLSQKPPAAFSHLIGQNWITCHKRGWGHMCASTNRDLPTSGRGEVGLEEGTRLFS